MKDKTVRFCALILLLFWLAACASPVKVAPSATARPSATPVARQETRQVIQVSLGVRGSAQLNPEIAAGSSITLEANFAPLTQTVTRRADGSVESLASTPWQDAPRVQMRFCLGDETRPCVLGEWQPLQPQMTRDLQVDWLGKRQFQVVAEFADAAGQPIPAVDTYTYETQPQTHLSMTIFASLNLVTPVAQFPAPLQTAMAATQSAYPVSGSVQIEEGRCCAGGTAGATLQLHVAFQAASRTGQVTEMKTRVGPCIRKPSELEGAWEPFQAQRTYETTLALNWVGWSISVQYRDSAGNLSPVYCDDISLEGSPAKP